MIRLPGSTESEPASYLVAADIDRWQITRHGEEFGSQPTKEEAIEEAKAHAALEGGTVEWTDSPGDHHGPVSPARHGWSGPFSRALRSSGSVRRAEAADSLAPASCGQGLG